MTDLEQKNGLGATVAVVIPAYKVGSPILELLSRFDDSVSWIFVVDDCCPEGTGQLVRDTAVDNRVRVVSNETNLGVGGATAAGFREAFDTGASIIVKLDGDGQHHPEWVPELVAPIALGEADMVKGNRFLNLDDCIRSMPFRRLIANMALSFLSKPSTGYWNLFDPANGFIAIHRKIVGRVPWDKVDKGYFFETDLLFRVGMLTAKVVEVPVEAVYDKDAMSGVRLWRLAMPFALKSLRNLVKRVAYGYFLRGFGLPSILLVLGSLSILFGILFGLWHWIGSREAATAGTVMVAGLPILAGIPMLMEFLRHDVSRQPVHPVHPRLPGDGPTSSAGGT